MPTILKDFLLMLPFKWLIDCLLLLFNNTENGDNKVGRDSHRKYFQTVIENTFFQEWISPIKMY